MEMKHVKILIVEDSLTQAEELIYILENHDFDVQHALDGEKAIELLNQFRPNIIISDIIMPGMDGYQFCSAVKSDDNLKKIPVILLTSLSDLKDVMKGLECGADSFFVKPYTENLLISRIDYFIQNSELRKNLTANSDLEVLFANQKYLISSSRQQIMDILLATYENSILKNNELIDSNRNLKLAQDKLIQLNATLEEKVKRRTEELEKTNFEKSELNATKDRLFSIIAHDLSSNFNPLLGFADLLLERTESETLKAFHALVLKLSSALKAQYLLLENLLEWGRLQQNRVIYCSENVNLYSSIQKIITLFALNLQKKEIVVILNVDPDLLIYTDINMLDTILRNLICNAIKFSYPKGEIKIQAEQVNGFVQVDVKDNGMGIDSEDIDKLFKENEFVSISGTDNEKGSGLGLIICKAFVERIGGEIWVDSELGNGAAFCFTIPVYQA